MPLGLRKKIANLLLVILEKFNLNTKPLLRQLATGSDVKNICYYCCISDPIIAKLSILKSGYVPGEQLVFNASIDNNSNYEMQSVSLRIIQYITCMASGISETPRSQVAEIKSLNKIDKKKYQSGIMSVTFP